jgi:RHS repeat-associated protein
MVPVNGRANVLNAFAVCAPFRDLAGTLYRETFWLVSDRLGTPRMVLDKSGSLAGVKRHDYLPFGEELYAGTGARTTGWGYTGDSTRQKFTGYEADGETGLNFAQARYQSSAQGRFTSVDPLGKSANVLTPQSFNRFSYVLNNPTNNTDPTGMMTMIDASMNYGEVSGLMGGGDFGGPETGQSIIAAASAHYDQAMLDLQKAAQINDALRKGKITPDEARKIVKADENLAIDDDNSISVTAAHVDPPGTAGEVSGIRGESVDFSVPVESGIFEDNATFSVSLALRLPKDTTSIDETMPEETTLKRTVVVHGSSVDVGTTSTFQYTTSYENSIMGRGNVTFTNVNFKERTATAHFSLSTKIYDPHGSHTALVSLVGDTKHHHINTVIKVTIKPRLQGG